jgi:very-short-patch-repair endonuclease
MDEFAGRGWIDVVIAELAARQHGVVARWQLLALGIGRGAIDARILRKRLHPVHRGVYALTPATLEPRSRWMAAVLAAGEGGRLSYWSAASLWQMRPGIGPRSHVTSSRNRRSNHKVTFHRAPLPDDEVTIEQNVPCTTPARTLLDLAPLLPSPILARMIDVAPDRGAPLAALLERYSRRPGAGKLRLVVASARPMTRSDLEARVLHEIARAELPRPRVNVVVEGYEVDFVWPEERVIAELDTYVTHGSRIAFERDRERDRRLAIAGWTVVRITDETGVGDLSRLLAASAARSRAAA